MKDYTITINLTDVQRGKLSSLTSVLRRADSFRYGEDFPFFNEQQTLTYIIRQRVLREKLTLDEALDAEFVYQREYVAFHVAALGKSQLEHDGEGGDVPACNPSPEATPETLVTVRDASGVVREVTLDEAEEMREAAQGIYNGEPPEPDFEPDAPEEEPETVSNAEEAFPAVRHGPLMDDKSDYYFYYLEHGYWPSDDEVLAGADVPCTGDYGLSDCLVVTQSALDFVDAFFT